MAACFISSAGKRNAELEIGVTLSPPFFMDVHSNLVEVSESGGKLESTCSTDWTEWVDHSS